MGSESLWVCVGLWRDVGVCGVCVWRGVEVCEGLRGGWKCVECVGVGVGVGVAGTAGWAHICSDSPVEQSTNAPTTRNREHRNPSPYLQSNSKCVNQKPGSVRNATLHTGTRVSRAGDTHR